MAVGMGVCGSVLVRPWPHQASGGCALEQGRAGKRRKRVPSLYLASLPGIYYCLGEGRAGLRPTRVKDATAGTPFINLISDSPDVRYVFRDSRTKTAQTDQQAEPPQRKRVDQVHKVMVCPQPST